MASDDSPIPAGPVSAELPTNHTATPSLHPYLQAAPFIAMAHRGGALEKPENSRSAFSHARDLGYRYIETDVRGTRDGVVIIHHDDTLDRTTDGYGLVRKRSWDSIRRMRHRSGDRVMRLEDALELFPTMSFNIDCKDDHTLPMLVGTLEQLGRSFWPRLCIASFSDERVAAVQRHFGPAIATTAGKREASAWVASGWGVRKLAHTNAVAAQVPVRARGLPIVTARLLRTAQRLGRQVHAWTVNDEPTMRKLLDLGVHGIITDRPTLLRSVLAEYGLWHEQ